MSVPGVGDVIAVLLADLLAASRMHPTVVTIKVNGCHLILVNRVSAWGPRSSPAFGAKWPEEPCGNRRELMQWALRGRIRSRRDRESGTPVPAEPCLIPSL